MRIYTDTLAEALEHTVAYEMAGHLLRIDVDIDCHLAIAAHLSFAGYDDELITQLLPRVERYAKSERARAPAGEPA